MSILNVMFSKWKSPYPNGASMAHLEVVSDDRRSIARLGFAHGDCVRNSAFAQYFNRLLEDRFERKWDEDYDGNELEVQVMENLLIYGNPRGEPGIKD
jgi:hypothetical protein